jgi:hypothetical protein
MDAGRAGGGRKVRRKVRRTARSRAGSRDVRSVAISAAAALACRLAVFWTFEMPTAGAGGVYASLVMRLGKVEM